MPPTVACKVGAPVTWVIDSPSWAPPSARFWRLPRAEQCAKRANVLGTAPRLDCRSSIEFRLVTWHLRRARPFANPV